MDALFSWASTRIGLLIIGTLVAGFALFQAVAPAPVSPPDVSEGAAGGSAQWAKAYRSNGPRYSNQAIRTLNAGIPLPDDHEQSRQEYRKLTVQQRRFEQRYGKDSVAARSVRMRLQDLREHAMRDVQYIAADTPQNTEPE